MKLTLEGIKNRKAWEDANSMGRRKYCAPKL